MTLGKLFTHMCRVTEQFNLVLDVGQMMVILCSWEVTAGLTENNSSLLPHLCLSHLHTVCLEIGISCDANSHMKHKTVAAALEKLPVSWNTHVTDQQVPGCT